ncbi:hypothetical protein M408DRAFT_328313 [Serendipita vermifera MAFF 305830]|uniref:Uncharacterized protein n=1 Tax=Serendipita vermifera MAFF 305830 TaxID=933852 RepID=A0A0C3BDR6_SERVB|nr:hypothetical protein M408DRAFT_328313 [Serendipita vermifera MAFF 305830]
MQAPTHKGIAYSIRRLGPSVFADYFRAIKANGTTSIRTTSPRIANDSPNQCYLAPDSFVI